MPAALRDEVCGRHLQRRDGADEVGLQDALRSVEAALADARELVDAGVGDEHIDATERLQKPAQPLCAVRRVGDIQF